MQRAHSLVTVRLGQNARCSNRGKSTVSFNKALVRRQSLFRNKAIAINEHEFGKGSQLLGGLAHGFKGGLQNVDAINFLG